MFIYQYYFLEIKLKFCSILFVFLTISIITTQAIACNELMGGCSPVLTHDTSSHMKSQIVNKVEKQATPAIQSTATNAAVINHKTKIKSANKNTATNILQAASKQVLR